ncbi:MAG: aminotransferase class I/II-fold pyridoxal phosphate-dependent enzyme, partial [Acidimicrobiales bacterium]
FAAAASRLDGGAVDLSVGTPCDPPPRVVIEALAGSGTERGYPAAAGSPAMREAAAGWIERRFGLSLDPAREIAACVGTKEMVASLPMFLHLRSPDRDTILHPSLAYPTYEMGATLAGLRHVAVAPRSDGLLDLASISAEDAERALVLWVNSPGNPAGQLEDLGACAEWGRSHAVPVFSDECYVEFVWAEKGRGTTAASGHTILEHGLSGVVAVHSLSKRSNLAGVRAGVFAGDGDLVSYLAQLRRHGGLMVPGPVQAAAAVAFCDDEHVFEQRERYLERLQFLARSLTAAGVEAALPKGSFYLWVKVPERFEEEQANGDGGSSAFSFGRLLAEHAGVVVSPGDTYGRGGRGYVRLALVQPMERLELVVKRLAGSAWSKGAR